MTDLLTVVSPVYNEEDGIDEFHRRLVSVISDVPDLDFEIVYVDDGSKDSSFVRLIQFTDGDPRVRVLRLSRNFGHQAAITCGLDHARGDAVVVIDSDLQDPPEVIPRMIERWRAGAEVVYGVRSERRGESIFKRATASGFYRILNWVSDTPLPLDAGDFRLLDRVIVEILRDQLREETRYMRGLVSWVGFEQEAVTYERDPRHAGDSKYTLSKMLGLALGGITSFSERPLRLSLQLGGVITGLAGIYALWITVRALLVPEASTAGFATIMVAVFFFGGVQLLSIGLLGEYIGRIYREVKERPLYLVAEEHGPSSS